MLRALVLNYSPNNAEFNQQLPQQTHQFKIRLSLYLPQSYMNFSA